MSKSDSVTVFLDYINDLIYVFLTDVLAFGFYHNTYNRLSAAFTDEYSSCLAESLCYALYSILNFGV